MDYYSETHFSLNWPAEACQYALRFKAALDEPESADDEWRALLPLFDDDPPSLGFTLTERATKDGLDVSAPGYLYAESLAIFIQVVLRKFDLPPVQFEWANYGVNCTPDAFGGGAAVVSREKITLMTTADWLYRMQTAPPEAPTPFHPAPGFLTTVVAQETNRRLEQLFDLLSQVDAAFKQGLPDSLATLNVALDLNAGHLNGGAITYDQWRALYQPVMTDDRPQPFARGQLPDGISPRQRWTLLPGQNDGWVIAAGDAPDAPHHPRFLTGVPWNNRALVVNLDQDDPVVVADADAPRGA
ncbi:MAG: hypothetical protein Kow0031_10820 [Anaerolineae bacterium]